MSVWQTEVMQEQRLQLHYRRGVALVERTFGGCVGVGVALYSGSKNTDNSKTLFWEMTEPNQTFPEIQCQALDLDPL